MSEFKLPSHCGACGAALMGGATTHKPGCEIQQMIDEVLKPPVPLSGYDELPDGRVQLTMSRPDFEALLFALGHMTAVSEKDHPRRALQYRAISNRINVGNPNWRPLEI